MEEVHLLALLLQLGNMEAIARQHHCPRPYVAKLLRTALYKLAQGKEDYERVAPFASSSTPLPPQTRELILWQRPFALWGYPRKLLNVLEGPPQGWRCFQHLREAGGLPMALQVLHGIGPFYRVLIRKSFETMDVHHWLLPPEQAQHHAHQELAFMAMR